MVNLDERSSELAVRGDEMVSVGESELTLLGIEEVPSRAVPRTARRFPWPPLVLALMLLSSAYFVFDRTDLISAGEAVAADSAPIVATSVARRREARNRPHLAVVSASLLPLRSLHANPVESQADETEASAQSRPRPRSLSSTPSDVVPMGEADERRGAFADSGDPPSAWSEAQADSQSTVNLQPSATAASADSFGVQLTSQRSIASAWSTWERLSEQNSDLLGSLSAGVETANLSGRGTYYRLRVGEFDEAAEARTLCAALASRSLDCLVVSY